MGTGSCGNVRELERDVPAADEKDSFRQLLQVEKLLTRRCQLGAGDSQIDRSRPGSHNHVSSLHDIVTNLERCRPYETGSAMERGYAVLDKTLFAVLWNALGKGTFELHQLRPINLSLIGANPVFSHAASPIEDFCGTDEHFLRVAAAQSAGASEWSRINDRNVPSGLGQRIAAVEAAEPVPITTTSYFEVTSSTPAL